MSLSSHLVEHIRGLEKQWALAVKSLPERELIEQRNTLRERAVDTNGEAMVLRILNAEIERRHGVDVIL